MEMWRKIAIGAVLVLAAVAYKPVTWYVSPRAIDDEKDGFETEFIYHHPVVFNSKSGSFESHSRKALEDFTTGSAAFRVLKDMRVGDRQRIDEEHWAIRVK